MTQPTSAPLLRTHPITGHPITPLGMSKRGAIWPILGGDDTVPPTPTPPAGGDPAPTPPSGDTPPAGGTTPPTPAPDKAFTQADLDRIVGERIKSEQTKHQKALDALQATAGKSELEAAQIKQQQAEAALKDSFRTSGLKVATMAAKIAATGAREDRREAVLAQAKTGIEAAVGDDGTVDEAAVNAAVTAVLESFPEWKVDAVPPVPGASGVPMGTGGTPPASFTRDQIKAMTPEEYVKNREAIHKAMAAGLVKG